MSSFYGAYTIRNEKFSLNRPYYQDYPRKKKKRHKKVFNETIERFGEAMKSVDLLEEFRSQCEITVDYRENPPKILNYNKEVI